MNTIPGVIRYDRKDRVTGQLLRFYQHTSGFRIDMIHKRGYRNKYAAFLVPFGAEHVRYEEDGREGSFPLGTAHFLEHILMSSQELSGPLFELSRLGINIDAATSGNYTMYSFSTAENFLPALKLLAELLLRPKFSDELTAKESEIIGAEMFMYKEDVSTVASQLLLRNLYFNEEIYEDILGNAQSIHEITTEHLKACYELLYQIRNMTLILLGDFGEEEENRIVSGIADFLDAYCSHAENPRKILEITDSDNSVVVPMQMVELPSSTSSFWIGYKKTFISDKKRHGGRERIRASLAGNLVLNMFLGSGSLLFERLYTEGLVDESLTLNYIVENGYAYVTISGDSMQPERLCNMLCTQLEEYIRLGAFDEKRMNELIRSNIGDFLRDMDDLDLCGEAVAGIRRNNMEFSDYASIFEQLHGRELLDELSFITPEQRACVIVHGKMKG